MKSPRRCIAGLALALMIGAAAQAQPTRPPTRLPFKPGPARQIEKLGRGVVAINNGSNAAFVSWRILGTDPANIAFNLYRSTGGGAPVLVTGPVTGATNYTDAGADLAQTNAYFVTPIIGGVEQAASGVYTMPANPPIGYLRVPLQVPPGGTVPVSGAYTYRANDCSVADLDGDGEYEIIVKWDPTNSQDNANEGVTGNVLLDAYKLDGTLMWRIDLGRNIRAGAHYTQFLVYDFDGDGKAELMCKTADATVDGVGNVIGNAAADYRDLDQSDTRWGRVLSGPEYLTVFDGMTGRALATTNYVPARGNVGDWGDTYGNRVDRFIACVAYLDGVRPSAVFCRGYYTRTAVVAWDWRNGQLTQRWHFDTRTDSSPATPKPGFETWEHMGNHQISVADVDGDGKDEILFGAICVDDNGQGLYSTGIGHGDAYHVSDMDPDRPGLEVFGPHEVPSLYGPYGIEMHDARTGQIIWGATGDNSDVGRGCAADIDPRYRGYECWGARPLAGGLYSCKGQLITRSRPSNMNFLIWWDGDLLRELLDGSNNDGGTGSAPVINKWNWNTNTTNTILTATGCYSNNSTKATPCLCADILGDWREEAIWRSQDTTELRIFSTTIPTTYRLYTLMHDHQYRMSVAWQNVAYNQPTHPGFYLGDGMGPQPPP
jgi:rhamnogalacturonan endolyase